MSGARAYWRPFGVAIAAYLLGRVVTTIGSYYGSRAGAIGAVVILIVLLALIAVRLPRASAIVLLALSGIQTLIWIAQFHVSEAVKNVALIVLNGLAAAACVIALRHAREAIEARRRRGEAASEYEARERW